MRLYFVGNIKKSLLDLIGNTPMVELTNFNQINQTKATIIAKLESFNPLGSSKDRVGYHMIMSALNKGIIDKSTTIIEPTSGNTGIGLAYVCAIMGMKLILTMPETMSQERIKLLKALGADVILTDGMLAMKGSILKAEELAKKIPNSYIPQQFENEANSEIHRETTAKEIIEDTDGKVDIFIAGVGTGGTITGIGEVLKQYNPQIHIVAVEPDTSPLLSGGTAGPHKLQGIGANFIPSILNTQIYDEVYPVSTDNAYEMARTLAKTDGILCGISSGAALYAGLQLALKTENAGKNIVVLLPDSGERYLSTDLFK